MTTRREVLKWGATAPMLAATAHPAFAHVPEGIDALVLDDRFPALTAAMSGTGAIMRIRGDVTQLWFDVLDRRWRQPGMVLGGVTGSDSLFVLERLAEQQGRHVVERRVLGEANARGVSPVAWIIAPHHPSVKA